MLFFIYCYPDILFQKPDKTPPPDWPSEGQIIFKNTELKYSRAQELVLHGMNIEIQPREKVCCEIYKIISEYFYYFFFFRLEL